MDLNVPDTRQRILADRLAEGRQIVAAEVAAEFAVSLDTIRRDILALEAGGRAQRVRGGAVPVARPASPLHARLSAVGAINVQIVLAAIDRIGTAETLVVDGGVTTLMLMARLPTLAGRLVITPSPWIAVACQERDVEVFLIGGRLSPRGGIAVGEMALERVAKVAADIAILGACGLETEFGLSSDDHDEALMKQAMHAVARQTFVVTDGVKIGRRARHHTLDINQIDAVFTDAEPERTGPLSRAGTEIVSVPAHNDI